jgi:hypothetical protein
MDNKDIGWEGVNWIDLAHDRAGCWEHSNELYGFIKCGEFLDQLRSNRILKKGFTPLSYL